ncbi:DUF3152 domain-containing protein [Phytoactinopolyspora alkaliphila]|uniref:DUF3152 domain-containing protein n=1 Tax=Phytoactinopolyspora alkaliphila TaxID=1783498 RepID=A0A6N9YRM2_9ACTN|nr:DUF3152 domain-containing protein [Phytoactinopolyspora alkaliphila]NED97673.1 DUF3152 domain-containing protein [Phytoactinopolyspora alkaliphila]
MSRSFIRAFRRLRTRTESARPPAHPARAWRALLGSVILLCAGAATIVAAVPGEQDGPTDGRGTVLAGPQLGHPDVNGPDDPAQRDPDHSRSQDSRRKPTLDPSVPARVYGPVVNGRRQPYPVDPPDSAEGKYRTVPGGARPPRGRSGDVRRYVVEVERGLPFSADEFADDVHSILNDERGWGHDDSVRFRRVERGDVDFRVSLSSAGLTDDQCYPLLTRGRVSCWNGTRAVINAERWGLGSRTFGADLLSYREYLINHEVGHALGHGHVGCPAEGARAPVMVQQTKSLEGCTANPWPAR